MKTTLLGLLSSFAGFLSGLMFGYISGDGYSISLIGGCLFGILILLWNQKE